ncbi:S41 family peptidase [Priestia endophytica]
MKKIWKWLLGILAIIVISLGLFIFKYGPNFNIYLIPPTPEKYGEIALNKMETIGLYTNTDKWKSAKEKATSEIKKATSIDNTIEPLTEALKVAGGKHSFIDTPSKSSSKENKVIYPTSEVKGDILYVTVPEFSGNQEEAHKYAETLSESIHKQYYKGIILDFQNNRGGDMGPMVAGLSALLPDENLITFINRDGDKQYISLKDGKVSGGGSVIQVRNNKKVPKIPIALIINDKTGSSGEITALCFKGMENVKFLGTNSAGYTSGNVQFILYDRRVMQVTSLKVKDRTGKTYENEQIVPDVRTNNGVEEAVKWINNE